MAALGQAGGVPPDRGLVMGGGRRPGGAFPGRSDAAPSRRLRSEDVRARLNKQPTDTAGDAGRPGAKAVPGDTIHLQSLPHGAADDTELPQRGRGWPSAAPAPGREAAAARLSVGLQTIQGCLRREYERRNDNGRHAPFAGNSFR